MATMQFFSTRQTKICLVSLRSFLCKGGVVLFNVLPPPLTEQTTGNTADASRGQAPRMTKLISLFSASKLNFWPIRPSKSTFMLHLILKETSGPKSFGNML